MAKLILRDLPTNSGATTGSTEKKSTFLIGAEVDQNFINLNAEVATKAPINNPTFTGAVIISDGIIDGVNIGATDPGTGKFTNLEVNRTASTSEAEYSLHVKSSGSTANSGRAVFSQGSLYGLAITPNGTGGASSQARFQWITLSTGALHSTPMTLNYDGSVTFTSTISANGSELTNLNATQLTSGTVPAARLTGTYSISVSGNAGTVTNGVYTNGSYANPAWISSLDAGKLTGTISGDRGVNAGSTSVSFVTYNGLAIEAGSLNGSTTTPTGATRLNYEGYLYATRFYGLFYGNGAGITGLDASQLSSGTVPAARLSGSYSISVTSATTATTAGNVTGTVAVANGGTGATTAANARTNLGATVTGANIFTASDPRAVASLVNQGTFLTETNGGTMLPNAHYSISTSGGVVAMNIPSFANTTQGDRILVTNRLNTWGTNAFTLTRVANTFIGGLAESMTCNANVQGFELVCSHKSGTDAYWNVFVF